MAFIAAMKAVLSMLTGFRNHDMNELSDSRNEGCTFAFDIGFVTTISEHGVSIRWVHTIVRKRNTLSREENRKYKYEMRLLYSRNLVALISV